MDYIADLNEREGGVDISDGEELIRCFSGGDTVVGRSCALACGDGDLVTVKLCVTAELCVGAEVLKGFLKERTGIFGTRARGA